MRKKWEEFEKKHEKIAKLLIQLLYFWVFSMGVTVLQYLMFTFFPYMFGIEYAGQEFMWPQIPMHVFGIDYKWNILGYEVARNAAGEVIIGGGLGYFISYIYYGWSIHGYLFFCIQDYFPGRREKGEKVINL